MTRLRFSICLVVCFFLAGCGAKGRCLSGDCAHGRGIMKVSSKISGEKKYNGDFLNGRFDGDGILAYQDGRKYKGKFENGKFVAGIVLYPNGNTYEGQLLKEKPHGEGVLTLPDGRKYIGEFRKGEFSGNGKLVFPDGQELECRYKNGVYFGGN